ncbi:MAG TPA: M14/M99 family metallopeptidase [bacterium]|nr:M14/M99 family metallopeptidase [bacterium]HPN42672.1 M14/M99 family metallopeptidase [bacterium]
MKNSILNVILLFCLISYPLSIAAAEKKGLNQTTYFKDTPYELNVYKIIGRIPNKTMLVIGGIQGDEPTGYLAADHYVDLDLEKGTLIMVPRANFNTIIQNSRALNGDMNRKFTARKQEQGFEEKIVEVLKGLIAESDVLLNLHEGSGFYREVWISDQENPMRYGQSIIADIAVYHSEDSSRTLNLEEIAREVITNVNKKIADEKYSFHFNNHNTFSQRTRHAEQRTSATFYALSNFGIPAFGIESSKDITDLETKVRHQIWIINEFMRLFDIVPEVPRLYLDYPELKFIIVTVNDNKSEIIPNNKTLHVKKDDIIEIDHVEANYKRGLSVDVLDYGTLNDFRTRLKINRSTTINVKKDKFLCGEIKVLVNNDTSNTRKTFPYLVLDINGAIEVFDDQKNITLKQGDIVKLIDTVPSSKADKDIRINLYGFIPDKLSNNADDRNVAVNTARDLMPEYAEDQNGQIYKIRIESGNTIYSVFRLQLEQSKLMSVKIRNKDMVFNVKSGETIQFIENDAIEIIDIEMNNDQSIDKEKTVKVNFKGYVGRGDAEDRHLIIPLDKHLLKEYSINSQGLVYPVVVTLNKEEIGKIFIEITN